MQKHAYIKMSKSKIKTKLWLVVCLSLSVIVMYSIYRYYCVHRISDSDYYWHIMLGKLLRDMNTAKNFSGI